MPAKRRCSWPTGCLNPISTGSRCRDHQPDRGTTTERGYGHDHQVATKKAKAGATHCTSCGAEFTTSNPATGGHRVARRRGGTAADGITPQCRKCNYGWRRTGL